MNSYNWPCPNGLTPFEHQKVTSEFLLRNKKGFVFNEQGTGKTASVIWASDHLMQLGLVKRVLIVCPLSIMHSAWQEDLFKFAVHRHVDVAYGSANKRKNIVAGVAEYVVINFDGVDIVKKEIINGGFDLVVIDEASAYKNAQTARWKTMRDVMKHIKGLWMLTGTPAAQSPVDAYGLAKLVNPKGVPLFYGQFRDMVMYPVTQYRWAPKDAAKSIVHQVLQPAIRFEKAQCLDLPEVTYIDRDAPMTAQQLKFYKELKNEMLIEAADEEITAVNAAVKLNKLLQIACIAYNTPVLTQNGWVPIQAVGLTDLIWDGVEFVSHKGLLPRGRKPTIECFGVRMTNDHKVLTNAGWRTAEESVGFNRADVWLPDSNVSTRYERWENQKSPMALSMPMRQRDSAREPVSSNKAQDSPKALWVPTWQQDTRNDRHSPIQNMVEHETTLFKPEGQRLSKLWGAWNNSVWSLGEFLRQFLDRHVPRILTYFNARSHQQRWALQSGKLSVGYGSGAGQQHSKQCLVGHAKRANDAGSSSASIRTSLCDIACAALPLQVAPREGTDYTGEEAVFDIADCGPRNRFVVLGKCGNPLIVHNCGSIYTDNGGVVDFDASSRLQAVREVVDEASHKVLIFVPFTHTINLIKEFLTKHGVACAVINGEVPVAKRSALVTEFQNKENPRVLIIQPQAASHGLTLTAADTIIWYAPVTSVETYLQANARINRPGQRNAMTVVHIKGSPIEGRLYSMLRNNIDNHQKVVELYRQELEVS